MGFSWTKLNSKSFDPLVRHLSRFLRKNGLNYGKVVTSNFRRLLNPEASSAASYQSLNNAYGVANDYKLDTRYRSLAELTGTK